jgi:hypothetical protein
MNYIYDIKFKFNDKFDFTLVKKKKYNLILLMCGIYKYIDNLSTFI